MPPATQAGGSCRIVDQEAATGIVGFPVKAGISSGAGVSKGGVQKVDGCAYAQIAVFSGESFITVAVTRADADVAKSQAEAIATAKVLIGGS